MAAGDIVYVGPGVYRETLTLDVSGSSGSEITYIGDVTGDNTDSVGGLVRITGSDNDQSETRSYCIDCSAIDYRVFRGFVFDMVTTYLIRAVNSPDHWTVEDCVFYPGSSHGVFFDGDNQSDITFDRCVFLGVLYGRYMMYFNSAGGVANTGNLIQNCLFTAGSGRGIASDDCGGITVRNCLLQGIEYGVRVVDALPGGYTAVTVENSILQYCRTALQAVNLGELTEDYNTFYQNNTDRTTVNAGGNSLTYPGLLLPPLLFSGQNQASGFKFPWWFGSLSEWSQVRAITGNNEPSVDLWGIGRPVTASKNSWGPCQFVDSERETGTVHAGSVSIALHDAGRVQIFVPVDNSNTTISVYVYRENNYAGNLPQMIIKQPGVADRTTTDVGAAGGWNQLSDGPFAPAATPPYVVVELVSRNTAAAGNYEVFFDDLDVS